MAKPCPVRRIEEQYGCKRKGQILPQAEEGENGGHFGTETDKIPRLEVSGSVKEKGLTEESVPEFCLFFAEIALQLASTKAKKEVENIIPLVSDASFDACQVYRHLEEIDGCKRTLHDCGRKELVEKMSQRKF